MAQDAGWSSAGDVLGGVQVLDGALATELEARGCDISGPLWSGHVLEDAPEKILAVHRSYIEAGAQCVETASYQVSRMGYAECGLTADRADAALLRSVELARAAAAEFPVRKVVVAASLGPYGAALHNGAEYTGDYDCTYEEVMRFHRERIAVLANAPGAGRPDLLALETLPSLDEARAVAEALAEWPYLPVWLSFTCRDAKHVAHGERLRDCAELLTQLPQTAAIGVNCTHPAWVEELIGEIREVWGKPIVVYPNSGESWDGARRCFTGPGDTAEFAAYVARWFAAGAQIVGGCCRTGPEHIRRVTLAAHDFAGERTRK